MAALQAVTNSTFVTARFECSRPEVIRMGSCDWNQEHIYFSFELNTSMYR